MVEDGTVTELRLAQRQRPEQRLDETVKTVNVALLRRTYLDAEFRGGLERLIHSGGENAFYETVFADTVSCGRHELGAVDCADLRWYEVDSPADLVRADYVFGTPEQRLAFLDGQHGGYWRHGVVDHRMLDNPWFPPAAMTAAMAAEFPDAMRHYPPGQAAFGALLAAVVGQPVERLVVANGASELIKVLGPLLGRVVLTVPNFNEYEQVLSGGTARRFELVAPGFALDPDELLDAAGPGIDAVIVTSPNNPTSQLVPREDLLHLAKELRDVGARLLVDESFIDFSGQAASVAEDVTDHPNLVVIKSMSKAYGVGGIRLGYLATADLDFAAAVRAELPIWNLNGIAESFLRLLPHHAADFAESLRQVRAATAQLYDGLCALGLTCCPPEGNFVLVRLPDPWTGAAAALALFEHHSLLVKHCAGKSMTDGERYLRLASRTASDNDRLVAALAAILEQGPS
ncbi:aminotransferase class I/II-fold pyridoxal phosphate-dependent enzyme [Nocardia sp. CA-128927]|uniref:aminotransferase class I/II-fold pyridoxal phosphate-dependent enzyme n=1 Tax=Nocardia sp. CA-128927 TaxID=3239975 RepID=UPI003D956935